MPSGSIHGFFKRFLPGDPVARVSNVHDNDLVKNFIEGLCGCGCRVEKTTENGLLCCKIIVDGSSDQAAGETPAMATGRIEAIQAMVLGEASPGAYKFFGTDVDGVKGWYECIVLTLD
jgi:hypothetical protein